MYGNGQVSKQHVIQATSNAHLSMPKDILHQWLAASDPIKRGIYNIPTLMAYLERSQVIDRVKSSKLNSVGGSRPISKSSTLNFSSKYLVKREKKDTLFRNWKFITCYN